MMTRVAVRLPSEIKTIDAQWIESLLPQSAKKMQNRQGVFIPSDSTLAAAEHILIDAALSVSGGNRIQAAKMLGIGERTLRRKLNHC